MPQIYPWCGFVWRSTPVRRLARAIFSMRCVTSPSGRGATRGVSALRHGWTPTRWCTTWRNGQPSRRCAGASVAAQFVSLLAVVESACNPEVQFDFVSETRGLEYVAEARNETAN